MVVAEGTNSQVRIPRSARRLNLRATSSRHGAPTLAPGTDRGVTRERGRRAGLLRPDLNDQSAAYSTVMAMGGATARTCGA